jgi:lipoyl(octanoyl) transferase
MTEITVYFDKPCTGEENMARDEALLQAVSEEQLGPVLRFYTWQPATLSLGYFQSIQDRTSHTSSQTANCVRRASGGGAIMHDQELTYSLILPQTFPIPQSKQSSVSLQLYQLVHRSLVTMMGREYGAQLEFWDDFIGQQQTQNLPISCGEVTSSKQNEPFLCFQRRTAGDLVIAMSAEQAKSFPLTGPMGFRPNAKLLGSAQRRPKNAILQHGSLLLGCSTQAPELPGLNEILNTELHSNQVATAWLPELCRSLACQPAIADIGEIERLSGIGVAREKFHAVSWLEMR